MFSVSKLVILILVGSALCAGGNLRVCSEKDNLPHSNSQRQGFENELAGLVGRELGRSVQYVWLDGKPESLAKNLSQGACDVAMGLPSSVTFAATTAPYYRSSYVWISREDRNIHVASLDDPILHSLKIGVHYLGEDNSEVPPLRALAKRGLMPNIVGFRIYGNYAQHDQAGELIRAVSDRKIDVALVWGPLGGYFAKRNRAPLTVQAITPESDGPFLPFRFAISMGVSKNDAALKSKLDKIIVRRRPDIAALLHRYSIPTT